VSREPAVPRLKRSRKQTAAGRSKRAVGKGTGRGGKFSSAAAGNALSSPAAGRAGCRGSRALHLKKMLVMSRLMKHMKGMRWQTMTTQMKAHISCG